MTKAGGGENIEGWSVLNDQVILMMAILILMTMIIDEIVILKASVSNEKYGVIKPINSKWRESNESDDNLIRRMAKMMKLGKW